MKNIIRLTGFLGSVILIDNYIQKRIFDLSEFQLQRRMSLNMFQMLKYFANLNSTNLRFSFSKMLMK